MKKQINIRLNEELIQEIDKCIDFIKFENRTQIIRQALIEFLERSKLNVQN